MEIGTSGTPHYQGYLELVQPRRLGWIKERLGAQAHLEKRKGRANQAILYCMKESGWSQSPSLNIRLCSKVLYGFGETWDELKVSSEKSLTSMMKNKERLETMRTKLVNGNNEIDIANDDFDLWVRHYRAFERYKLLITPPRDHNVDVTVILGPTGTGKSKWAFEKDKNGYWKQRSQWWCGYAGQETVVIDEFYGWLPFDLLLRICDRYPLLVETKGGQVQFVGKHIIFTTNKEPASWYKNVYFSSFIRRVTSWKYFPSIETHLETNNYEEFLTFITNL